MLINRLFQGLYKGVHSSMPSSTTSLASYFACVGLFAFSTAQADFPVTTPEPTSPPLSTPSNPVIGYPATVTPSVTTSPIAPPAPTPVPAQVIRAAFTTGLVAREPVNQLTRVNAGQTLYLRSDFERWIIPTQHFHACTIHSHGQITAVPTERHSAKLIES